jgi:hypothetical protein
MDLYNQIRQYVETIATDGFGEKALTHRLSECPDLLSLRLLSSTMLLEKSEINWKCYKCVNCGLIVQFLFKNDEIISCCGHLDNVYFLSGLGNKSPYFSCREICMYKALT